MRRASSRAMRLIERVLVPIDFSPRAATALRYAAQLGFRFGAALDVLHVFRCASQASATPVPIAVRAALEDHLSALFTAYGLCGHARLMLEPGPVVPTILGIIDGGCYDLVVVAAQRARRSSGESVVEALIRRSSCPLVCVRSDMYSLQRPDGSAPRAQEDEQGVDPGPESGVVLRARPSDPETAGGAGPEA